MRRGWGPFYAMVCGVGLAAVISGGETAWARGANVPQPLQAGVASRAITPPKPGAPGVAGAFIAGYDGNRVAEGAHDDLYARCLALRAGSAAGAGQTTVALCTVDLIGLLHSDVALIRQQVKGLPPERLLISATHTHSGPDTIGLWGPTPFKSGVDPQYMGFLRGRVAECIAEAVKSLQPAEIRFATAQSPPKTHKNSRAAKEIDDDISVLQVRRPGGAIVATLVNWGCHPEVLHEHLITSDVSGYLRQEVEKGGGGTALYFQGIVGGMVTADCSAETHAEAERIGRSVGAAALAGTQDAKWLGKLSVATRRAEVRLPVANLRFKLAAAGGVIPGLKPSNAIATEINVVDLGRAQIVTMPGEVLPALGLKMKGLLKTHHTFFFGLTSDELGYILPEEYCQQRLYDYEVSMSLGPKTGTLLYEALERLINPKP